MTSSVSSCSLAIVGDGSVGKSTIIASFKEDGFKKVYKQTVGVDFYEKRIKVRGNFLCSLKVWDVGGQSINSRNLPSYVGHSDVIILAYDVTNEQSFSNLDDWMNKIGKLAKPTAIVFLIGNKVDLIALRQITKKQHDNYVLDNERIRSGMFVSAKTGENVVKMFYKVSGEFLGLHLTEEELSAFDKVLVAHIEKSETNELRNDWASDIEREDMEAERRKKEREENGCQCLCS